MLLLRTTCAILLFTFLLIVPLEGTDDGLGLTKCEELYIEGDPSLCRVILEENTDLVREFQLTQAEGSVKIKLQAYPDSENFGFALISYDEPATLLLGASVWISVVMGLLALYYISSFVRNVLNEVRKELNLRPHTAKFPTLPLYWLQQSKREISLRREFRNTWAWLAKRYLLSPDDPLLSDIDEVMGRTTWADFHVPRGTWSLVDVILKHNHLCIEISHDQQNQISYSVRKDTHAKPNKKLNLFSLLTKLKNQFGNLDQQQKDRDEEKKIQEIESQRISSESDSGSLTSKSTIQSLRNVAKKPHGSHGTGHHHPHGTHHDDQKHSGVPEEPVTKAEADHKPVTTELLVKEPSEQNALKLEFPPRFDPPPHRQLPIAPVHKIKQKKVKHFGFTSKKVGAIKKLKEQIEAKMEDSDTSLDSPPSHYHPRNPRKHSKDILLKRKSANKSFAYLDTQRYVDAYREWSKNEIPEEDTEKSAKVLKKLRSKKGSKSLLKKSKRSETNRSKKGNAEKHNKSSKNKHRKFTAMENPPSDVIIHNTYGFDKDPIIDVFGSEKPLSLDNLQEMTNESKQDLPKKVPGEIKARNSLQQQNSWKYVAESKNKSKKTKSKSQKKIRKRK